MIIKGLVISDSIKYIKFVKSTNIGVTQDDTIKSLVISATKSSDLSDKYSVLKDIEFNDIPEYIKLPTSLPSINYPDFSIQKMIYEDLEVNIIVVNVDDENEQSDGNDNTLSNVYYYYYDRLTILLRSDKHKVSDLKELLSDFKYIKFTSINEDAEVGTVPKVILRLSEVNIGEYYSSDAFDFNGTISKVDWSHALDGFLTEIKKQLVDYDFNEPVTMLEQEIPSNSNLIKYDIGDLQSSNRGHLVGEHWKYFYMHKLPFNLEFVMTDTASYVRLLHNMQGFNEVTNILGFSVKDNSDDEWKVAVEWNFPIENDFSLTEPKGSSTTVGNSIKCSGFLHFYTVSKNKYMQLIEEIANNVNKENSVIN